MVLRGLSIALVTGPNGGDYERAPRSRAQHGRVSIATSARAAAAYTFDCLLRRGAAADAWLAGVMPAIEAAGPEAREAARETLGYESTARFEPVPA